MSDVKDILGFGRGDGAKPEHVPVVKQQKMKRPEGMSREAYALLGDQHPIISSQLAASTNLIKKKESIAAKPKPSSSKGLPTYQYVPFKNSARRDDLKLTHWIKMFKDASGALREQDDSDYHFVKFNKKVNMFKYDDEEYKSLIQPDRGNWSRAETDYLFDLCQLFDLRFTVIADRYSFPSGPSRSLEDLKERYFAIARKLLVTREGGEAAVANHVLVRHAFNKVHETERKRALAALLERTALQAAEENAVLAEARAIEERRRPEVPAIRARGGPGGRAASPAPPRSPTAGGAAGMDGAALSALFSAADLRFPADYTNDPGTGTSSLFDLDVNPAKPPKPGVIVRGVAAQQVAAAQTAALAGGARAAKQVEALLNDLGPLAVTGPSVNTRATVGTWLALRAEVIAYHELKRNLGGRMDDRPRKQEKRKR